jgi:hypothetical protein
MKNFNEQYPHLSIFLIFLAIGFLAGVAIGISLFLKN